MTGSFACIAGVMYTYIALGVPAQYLWRLVLQHQARFGDF